ncbi:MAG: tetratricopeptide repeat protein [Proteobacteria bacterium]|nr:tetratricopeptide repeat protein [Pseudomonadota bacterium]
MASKVAQATGVAARKEREQVTPLASRESEDLKNRGNVYFGNGDWKNAEERYRQAIARNPYYAEAFCNLGAVYEAQGDPENAVAQYRSAVELNPNLLTGHQNLGFALLNLGQGDAAEESFRRVLTLSPDHFGALQSLGAIAAMRDDFHCAERMLRGALALQSNDVDTNNDLGNLLKLTRRFFEAEESYRRALTLKPDNASTHYNFGFLLMEDFGQVDQAVASFRRALSIQPDYADAHGKLLFALDLAPGVDLATLQQERNRWEAIHAAPLAALKRPHGNRPDPQRRLRIGYVSADFRTHSATVGFGAMLVGFDPAGFDVVAYSNYGEEDAMTRLLRQGVTTWRNIVGLSDEAVANLIRDDEIDILVDLSGHSAGNRLLVFARKPAPLQVTAFGYPTGTGMRAMDALFADPVVVPPDERQFYAEEIRYLPCLIGAFFPKQFPAVNALPALSAEGITFGSFNRLGKISEDALSAWARILLDSPNSKIVLKTHQLDDPTIREQLLRRFTRAGVAPERIVLLGATSWQDHLAAFNRIDIALDPFPQGGGVTTLEGLMMGVPLVALRGQTIPGRASASILTTLGLTDWIAESPEQYVELAVQKARHISDLAALRTQLRGIFTSSIVGDSQAYVKAVEQEYRQLWREWCDFQLHPDAYRGKT